MSPIVRMLREPAIFLWPEKKKSALGREKKLQNALQEFFRETEHESKKAMNPCVRVFALPEGTVKMPPVSASRAARVAVM